MVIIVQSKYGVRNLHIGWHLLKNANYLGKPKTCLIKMTMFLDQIALLNLFFWNHVNLIKHGSNFSPRALEFLRNGMDSILGSRPKIQSENGWILP